jgi:rhodanese-related sulfurtransferase
MKHKIFSLLILFFFVTATQAQDTAGLAISQAKFERLMKKKNADVIDVRLAEEYKSGFIGQAVNYNVLDSLKFISQVAPLDKKKRYLLYCKSGRRSGKALVMLKNMGFKKVYHLKGGVTDWKGELSKPE